MKIAVFDPQPRIGGGTQFALHTAEGFRRLGHEVQTVAFTKSGRKMKYWGAAEAQNYKSLFWHPTCPEIVAHIDDCKEVLNSFDLIFLVEPVCHPQVAAAKRDLDFPLYQYALMKTKTRWVTHLHNPQYRDNEIEAMDSMFELKNFAGFTMTRPCFNSYPFKVINAPKIVTGALPYALRPGPVCPARHCKRLGYTGRISFNKGLTYYLLAADSLPIPWTVDVWGACFTTRPPCLTFMMAEALEELLGYKIEWEIPEEDQAKAARAKIGKPYPFTATKDEAVIRYRGAYHPDLPTERFMTFSIFAALTIPSFQRTMFEYTTLENLENGAMCIASSYQQSEITSNFNVLWLNKPAPLGSHLSRNVVNDEAVQSTTDEFVQMIHYAIELIDKGHHRKMVADNRAALMKYNDPCLTAQAIIDVSKL